jgi:hypothetical protein
MRAANAARNLALLAAPPPSEYDWLDVNDLVRKVLQLMRYDKRYRHLICEQDLSAQLPAVYVPASTLQQVLMQLMSLGCEAMVSRGEPGAALRVETRAAMSVVELGLTFAVHLDFALPEVQRVMLLTRSNLESLGGRFVVRQTEGPRLSVWLSLFPKGGKEE